MTGGIVWIASYPKSGSTWLRAVITAWQRGEVALNDMVALGAASRARFDGLTGILSSELTAAETDALRPRVDEFEAAQATALLLRKTHDGRYPGPGGESVISTRATLRAVYVIRDPRDVAVSYGHHVGQDATWAVATMAESRPAPTGSLTPQLHQPLGSWSAHVRSWTDAPPFPVHVVRYEDCVQSPRETFARALRFVFGAAEDADVARAVKRASFARLQAAEAEAGFRERRAESSERFFRSGRAGAWRDELAPGLAGRLASVHGEVMARFGYS